MSDLIERLKGLQEWYSRNTGEGILHAVHLNALSEAIALVAEQQERIETLQTQRSYDASLNEKRLESIEELEELYEDEQKSADALLDRIKELEAPVMPDDVVNGLKTVIDQREARIEELEAAVDEICRLTAPGGFPSYKHLHTITLKAKDAVTSLQENE